MRPAYVLACLVAFFAGMIASVAVGAEYMMVGVDSKVRITNDAVQKVAPGEDLVMVFEISASPEEPKLVAKLPLRNSMFGPPTNLAFVPGKQLAVVANSVNWVNEGGAWNAKPAKQLHLINITEKSVQALPHSYSGVGQQPSGVSVSRDGRRIAIANRADGSVTLTEVSGADGSHPPQLTTPVTVSIDGEAAAVAFTPDGKRILCTKFAEHAVAVIDVDGGKLSYNPENDLAVGRWPYNVQVTPNGRVALVANNGMNGLPDGHADTVSVVDLTANPPRVVDHVTVGDGPEGMAISPDGRLALVPLLQGSAPLFEGKWFHHKTGAVAVLSIDGLSVKKIAEVPTGRFPEGVGFSRDGRYAYVGDLIDEQISIFRIDGQQVTNTGKTVKLPGYAASLRTELP